MEQAEFYEHDVTPAPNAPNLVQSSSAMWGCLGCLPHGDVRAAFRRGTSPPTTKGVLVKVHILDQEFLGIPHAIASFLVEAPDGPILIETGPAGVQERLEQKVRALGFEPNEVKHVLVTHIHLDHSGGAGYWAARGSTIYVHPVGGPHLIDPSKLLASASRIYLDQMDYLWGTTLPVPAEQVVELGDTTCEIAGLAIRAVQSPGHASHHLAYLFGDRLFTGDVAGCRLPGCEYVSVPGPPPEFQLETWLESLDKLESLTPSKLYLTHFGEVDRPQEHFARLRRRLQDCSDFVYQNRHLSPQALMGAYQEWDRREAGRWGVEGEAYLAYEKANPSYMSAQGIGRYWAKKLSSSSAS